MSGIVGGIGSRLALVTDDGNHGTDVDGVIFLGLDFEDGTCDRGWNFGVDLVGGDLEQRLVDRDGIAHGLQPLGNRAFGYGFAQFGHHNGVCHK